jgi:chemotaxis response regulator CheB
MDFNMPRMDGCDATKLLRSVGVACPIIGVTAQTLSESQYGKECGMDAIMTKPTNTIVIAEVLLHYYFENLVDLETHQHDHLNVMKKIGVIMQPESTTQFYESLVEKLSTKGILVSKIFNSHDDFPTRNKLTELNVILIDTTTGDFDQLKKVQKLKNLGFKGEFYALTPVESELLTRTCKRYGIYNTITPSQLEKLTH